MSISGLIPDFYRFIRPLLFMFDAEDAHEISLTLIRKGFVPRFKNDADSFLATTVAGMNFPNPIGLAAGYDKQAEVMSDMLEMGFGFVEVGTITPKPQAGNPRPRLFRVSDAEAVINRFGFNSDGIDTCLLRIIAYHDARRHSPGILGVNIGKNKETEDAASDYVEGVRRFKPYADYLTVNVSSPNTPGLRDLQGAPLEDLLRRVMDVNAGANAKPIFVKIAPDQTTQGLEEIARVTLDLKIDGLIIGNTTVSRPSNLPPELAKEAGGLSGKPLRDLSTDMIRAMYRLVGGKIPIIGCGGISTAEDAYTKIRAGASLLQLYTSLVYHGPFLVARLNRELAPLLKARGFSSIAHAVGTDVT